MAPLHVSRPQGPATPGARLGEAVSQLMRTWIRRAREDAREHDLSLPQMLLLGQLSRRRRLPASRWAAIIGVTPPAATALLDGLETGGYLRREHDTQDRRQVLIRATAKGRAVAERLHRARNRRWAAACRGIPGDRLIATRETLERIMARLEREGTGRPPSLPAAEGA